MSPFTGNGRAMDAGTACGEQAVRDYSGRRASGQSGRPASGPVAGAGRRPEGERQFEAAGAAGDSSVTKTSAMMPTYASYQWPPWIVPSE